MSSVLKRILEVEELISVYSASLDRVADEQEYEELFEELKSLEAEQMVLIRKYN